jgi:hypothetical protein
LASITSSTKRFASGVGEAFDTAVPDGTGGFFSTTSEEEDWQPVNKNNKRRVEVISACALIGCDKQKIVIGSN